MAILEYERRELPVIIRKQEDQISIQIDNRSEKLFPIQDSQAPGKMIAPIDLADEIGNTAFWQTARTVPVKKDRLILRVNLDIRDPGLPHVNWDHLFFQALQSLSPYSNVRIVRVVHAPARVNAVPLSFPLRFIHIDRWSLSATDSPLKDFLRQVFGGRTWEDLADALVFKKIFNEDFFIPTNASARPSDWPSTAEVLHFSAYPLVSQRNGEPYPGNAGLLSTARTDTPGTLGWLSRLTQTWQTRLVVFTPETEEEAEEARELLTALAQRGGPAGLILASGADHSIYPFYDALIHDTPLDAAFPPEAAQHGALFIGAHRADLLRVSAAVVTLENLHKNLVDLGDEWDIEGNVENLLKAPEKNRPLSAAYKWLQQVFDKKDETFDLGSLDQAINILGDLRTRSIDFEFHERESGGLLPLARYLGDMRRQFFGTQRSPRESVLGLPEQKQDMAKEGLIDSEKDEGALTRHVNARMYAADDLSPTKALSQNRPSLVIGNSYLFGVQIGPKDEAVVTVGDTSFIEEVDLWEPGMEGLWLEVGMVGLDFEVLGDPVQEIWLPRDTSVASDPAYFTVIPKKIGAAQLRYCIYHEQDLLQSWRIAAIVLEAEGADPPEQTERIKAIADALELEIKQVDPYDHYYLSRKEYGLSNNIALPADRLKRDLSFVANDLNGLRVVTKAEDLYNIQDNINPYYIDLVRKTLDEISITKTDPKNWRKTSLIRYGGEDELKKALIRLADVGWNLYANLFSDAATQKTLQDLLHEKPRVIQAAHLVENKVIPWSMMYDRYIDTEEEDELEACLAAVPEPFDAQAAAGNTSPGRFNFKANRCGELESCLLKHGHDPDYTACPLHMWGFRHNIELPPEQKESPDQQICILPNQDKEIKLRAAINAQLDPEDKHAGALKGKLGKHLGASFRQFNKRKEIMDFLKAESDFHFLYFYCHGSGTNEDAANPIAHLKYWDAEKGRDRIITAAQLTGRADRWSHAPLVFLNACNSISFSGEGMPEFVTLLKANNAAGVIGTEIYVWEDVARNMANYFLENFLKEIPAGESLLIARRRLLSDRNPMGLIYTLFAAAELAIDMNQDGECKHTII